jgi:hypothetical protein
MNPIRRDRQTGPARSAVKSGERLHRTLEYAATSSIDIGI